MTGVDVLLVDAVERLLADVCTYARIEQAEVDGWCAPVWDALDAGGFCRVSLPEAAGGSGGSLADAMALLRSIGGHAAPVPLAETAVLGGWLLAQAGLELPDGPLTLVPDPAALGVVGGRLIGEASAAWARRSRAIAALVCTPEDWLVVRLRPEHLEIRPGANLAGEPRDRICLDVRLDALPHAPAPPGLDGDALRLRGALSRVALMAGATASLCDLTVHYTNERRQFGQPVARFQAVQQHLVSIAQCSVRLSMAADVATRAALRGRASREIAAAKLIAEEAAVSATRCAHQAHGAIGMTREYRLHHLSRRLWAWRHEYAAAREWRRRLGAEVASSGADALFETIVG
jgi:acyl-CoA dehydrogenase